MVPSAEVQPKAGSSTQKKKQKLKKDTPKPVRSRKLKRFEAQQKIETLDQDAITFVPPDDLTLFSDLPISDLTKRGLKKAFFVKMTDIQTKSIPVSLKGKDVLGAARTGSGKTLAFLVPVLEILYRRKWGPMDGLGALIISPTRELAVQIFDVLRSIGGHHSFSAGLVIGGKNLKDERDRLSRMNILVATPGRLLQHMDQTIGFDPDNLQILVLDEADRILDMGFARTLSALLSHLPKSHQTLLFSATQTQSVHDLARLSLQNPVPIGLDDGTSSLSAMPRSLEQHYVVCALDQKLDTLWSFVKAHLQTKTLVFLSSCKQVRFVFETFCRMHPGVPLLHLHGKQKQSARLATYGKFTQSKHAVLLATDIAARGLDFPAVDWVVQVDAPEDAETYIHRVGRTARYESEGKGLLFLMPSEEDGMRAALMKKGVGVQKLKIRPSKTQSVENHLQKLAFQDPEIKYLGQRAFVSYLRSVHLHKDKSIFKLNELPLERFAESLGLPGAPKIKFLSREMAKQKKNASRVLAATQADLQKPKHKSIEASGQSGEESGEELDNVHPSSEEESDGEKDNREEKAPVAPVRPSKVAGVRTKYDRMFERRNQNILSEHYSKLIDHDPVADDEEDFITLKRADHDLDDGQKSADAGADLSKRKLKLGRAKRAIAKNGVAQKLVFDDEGEAHEVYELGDVDEWLGEKGGLRGVMEEGRKFAAGERGKMQVADVVDKEEAREKKREKKRKRKERERALTGRGDDGGGVTLGPELFPLSEDDGYVSPTLDLQPSEDEAELQERRPVKRSKRAVERTVEEDEEMALRLLGRAQ